MVSRETSAPARLSEFTQLLWEANQSTNLVSRRLSLTDINNLVTAHAHLLGAVRLPRADVPHGLVGERLLDVGSGAGLPGIALAIYHPELRVVLAESRKRRAAELKRFVTRLRLDRTRVVAGDVRTSIQEACSPRTFEIVTAFGVGKAVDVIALVAPFIGKGGHGYLSIPAKPTKAEIGQWFLEAAFMDLKATVHLAVIDGMRSVLELGSAQE